VTVDATGNAISMLKYTAYGELRTGTSTTDYQYTLQKHPGQALLLSQPIQFLKNT
jgi:hypothetical protein